MESKNRPVSSFIVMKAKRKCELTSILAVFRTINDYLSFNAGLWAPDNAPSALSKHCTWALKCMNFIKVLCSKIVKKILAVWPKCKSELDSRKSDFSYCDLHVLSHLNEGVLTQQKRDKNRSVERSLKMQTGPPEMNCLGRRHRVTRPLRVST